ncbi:MAG TPA: sulfatase-like hydrolase/transferase [Vicinamibacterales bacterium]|jgi:arylsulfatase A-like enzyme/Tfp pilus assembly protein PilF
MPSAPKRGARSTTPRAPERAARATDSGRPARRRDARRFPRAAWLGGVFLLFAAITFLLVRRDRAALADLHPVANQNVLLITIDTLRADALGSYGGRAATPALDRLAAGGVRFDFAHAHAVLTLPSHASILTGTYPFQHGIRDNSGYRLPPDARTAAALLKQAGYATGAFVAAYPLNSRFGLNAGFDVYDDHFGETRAPSEFVLPERPATSVVALARQWISARGTQPWFTWVHVFEPHAPYRPPPPFDTQYPRAYDGEVAATDAALSPLLDDVRGSTRPTVVVVTGDHGEALGDHGEQTHGLFAYESTLRVPLIVAELGTDGREARGDRSPSEVSHTPARHVDILPTLLEAVGRPVPAGLPGRSLLSSAARHEAGAPPSYFEAMSAMLNRGWAPLTGVLDGRDKFIEVPIPERYDLATDAAESVNLEGRSPERDRTLAGGLRAFNAAPPGQRQAEDSETAARLRSLGYVTGNAPIKARYTEADDPKRLIAIDQDFHRGVDLYVSGRFDESIAIYRNIIERRPDMAIAYRHLAFVLWESGRTTAAVDVLKRAVAAGVTTGGVVTQLGTYLAESGDARAAISLLTPPATGDTDLDAINGLGIAYARSGRAADARRAFEHLLTIDPSSAMALTNLGALDLEHADFASARKRFEQAVQSDPSSSTAFAGLGVVASKSGDRDAAVSAWKRAVELDSGNYDALYNLGTTLARGGQIAEARPYLERFVRSAPPALYARDIREITGLLERR